MEIPAPVATKTSLGLALLLGMIHNPDNQKVQLQIDHRESWPVHGAFVTLVLVSRLTRPVRSVVSVYPGADAIALCEMVN